MIGGTVIETIVYDGLVWINVKDDNDWCAINVEACDKARCVSEGDIVWWQGGFAYWSPRCVDGTGTHTLKKVGNSGAPRPKIKGV